MSLLDYTTYAEVRAILGVSTTELPDQTLGLNLYAVEAELLLTDIYDTLPDLFATIKLKPTPTATEAKLEKLVSLYYSYAVAKQLLTSLPMFSVQTLEDGRASFTRFTGALEDIRDGVDSSLLAAKERLIKTLNTLIPGAVPDNSVTYLHIVATGLAVDPVTGV